MTSLYLEFFTENNKYPLFRYSCHKYSLSIFTGQIPCEILEMIMDFKKEAGMLLEVWGNGSAGKEIWHQIWSLSLIPRTHIVERENWCLKDVLEPPIMGHSTWTRSHMHILASVHVRIKIKNTITNNVVLVYFLIYS